jgi:O-antigen ligase
MKKETINILDKLTVWAFFCGFALCILSLFFICLYIDTYNPKEADVSLILFLVAGFLFLFIMVAKHFILFPYEIKSAIGKSS